MEVMKDTSAMLTYCQSITAIEDIWIHKNKKYSYLNLPCSFDIETSSFITEEKKQAVMYAWCFGVNGRVVYGRTWTEFIELIDNIVKIFDIAPNRMMLVYIHNLGYEFQFFRKLFEWIKVFAVDTRKPVYATTSFGIEFRCSNILSGYKLETVGKNLNKYKVDKLVGDLDYKLLRHTKTPLTDKELQYLYHDVFIVMSYIQEEIEYCGSIIKIPLTSTGYVRELTRERCLKGSDRFKYVNMIKHLTVTPEEYLFMRRTYMGGFTHANVQHVGDIIYNVDSYDFTSSYPAVMLSELYPMSKPFKVKIKNKEHLKKCLRKYCCMFEIILTNVESKVLYENYISSSKCFILENPLLNNGRVYKADRLGLYVTELDFKIITQMYSFKELKIGTFYCMYKGYLPKPIIEVILELYNAKTKLKGVAGSEAEYLRSKERLNSLYGMEVTDIYRVIDGYENNSWYRENPILKDEIDKYNNNRNRFLYYAWGVWVTAYARYNLFTGINECKEDYRYSDTDSIKIVNSHKHQSYFERYNKEVYNKCVRCLKHYGLDINLLKPQTIEGIEKVIGVWDYEGRYTRFKTLGAKRYIYEKDGDIHITIAGVNKSAGKKFLLTTFKTHDNIFMNFKEDLYFPAYYECEGEQLNGSGKLCHTYIDEVMEGTITDYLGVECDYKEQSGVYMDNTDYTMSLSHEFINLILGIKGGHINWKSDIFR